jgi:TPR repeat protein
MRIVLFFKGDIMKKLLFIIPLIALLAGCQNPAQSNTEQSKEKPSADKELPLYRGERLTESELAELKSKAESGDQGALSKIAWRYNKGIGVPQSDAEAFKWYMILAEKNDPMGMLWVGRFYKEGQGGVEKNYSKALYWLSKCEEHVDMWAIVEIPELYQRGDATLPKDEAKAKEWLEKANRIASEGTDRRYAVAQYILACEYDRGDKIPQDYAKAVEWFTVSLDNGHDGAGVQLAEACYRGIGTEKNPEKAWSLLKLLIRYDDTNRDFFVRQFPHEEREEVKLWLEDKLASDPVKPDPMEEMRRPLSAEELTALREKAEAGDTKSRTRIAWRYYGGFGVPQDRAEAMKWYKILAEAEEYSGMIFMGRSYLNGQNGLEKNYSKAFYWLSKCESEERARFMFDIYTLYLTGDETFPKDEAKAREWLNNARRIAAAGTERKHQISQYRLACEYADGRHIPQDDAESLKWFEMSAANGHEMSMVQAAEAHYKGNGTPVNKEKAWKWLSAASEKKGESNIEFFVRQFPISQHSEIMDWYRENQNAAQ